jgi:ABC-type glycerol-3-phosphate transport system permease component
MAALAALIVVLVIALTPYVWLFMTSIKSRLDALADTPVWLFTPTFEHYPKVFLDKAWWSPERLRSCPWPSVSRAPTSLPAIASRARRICSSSF